MTDWGTLVADWKGELHNVSKNAFDSLATSLTPPLKAGDTLLNNSFQDTFKSFQTEIVNKFGVDGKMPLTLENIRDQVQGKVASTAVRFAADSALALAGKYLGETFEGPLGLLISELAQVAISQFDGPQEFHYKPGQGISRCWGDTTPHQ